MIGKFLKPPNVLPQTWEMGVRGNPDPSNLVPTAIRGYDQLQQRAKLYQLAHLSNLDTFEKQCEKINPK